MKYFYSQLIKFVLGGWNLLEGICFVIKEQNGRERVVSVTLLRKSLSKQHNFSIDKMFHYDCTSVEKPIIFITHSGSPKKHS